MCQNAAARTTIAGGVAARPDQLGCGSDRLGDQALNMRVAAALHVGYRAPAQVVLGCKGVKAALNLAQCRLDVFPVPVLLGWFFCCFMCVHRRSCRCVDSHTLVQQTGLGQAMYWTSDSLPIRFMGLFVRKQSNPLICKGFV